MNRIELNFWRDNYLGRLSNWLGLFLFSGTSVALAQENPNILWLTYEDTSPQFIGCYGNEEAKTPVMDGLAA